MEDRKLRVLTVVYLIAILIGAVGMVVKEML